jgi:hypothetical protein
MKMPKRNISTTDRKMSAPRPVFLRRKCPAPGISHAATMGSSHTLMGGRAGLAGTAVVV